MTSPALCEAGDQFSRQDLCRILRVSDRQLATWQSKGLIPESEAYSFSDLIALKTISELRKNHVPIKRIQRSLEAMRNKLGRVDHPLTELKISLDGRHILVEYEDARLEPESGQFHFNFETRRASAPVRVMKVGSSASSYSPAPTNLTLKQEAEACFAEGLRLEESPDTVLEAVQAYQKAIELNPEAAGAYINLGTIHYNRQQYADAEKCYRAAAEIDPLYALAFFNLGNVFDERGDLDQARHFYDEALHIHPQYGDAHYNLALVLDKMGQRGKALHHWRRYLKLDPGSPWAAYARQQLARAPFTVVNKPS